LSSDTQLLRKKMKIFTVFLVIFILGFDFATPKDNILKKLRKAINKLGEKLEKQIENDFNKLNGKLTNIQSQNEVMGSDIREQTKITMVLETDLKEQTNLTMAKLDAVYNDMKNDSEALGTDLKEQTNLTMAKLDAVYNDIKDDSENQFFKLMDKLDEIQLEIKSQPSDLCSMNGNYFDLESGSCYKFEVLTDKIRNWNDAKTDCEARGSALATVNSSEESQFVKGILTSSGVNYVWLAASDKVSEGNWVWTDGSPVNFSDWHYTQPNGGTFQNCLYLYNSNNWQWHDGVCTNPRYPQYALCKILA